MKEYNIGNKPIYEFGKRLLKAKEEKGKLYKQTKGKEYTKDVLAEELTEYFRKNMPYYLSDDKAVSPNTVESHYYGKNLPKIEYLIAYSDILNISLDELIKGEKNNSYSEEFDETPEMVFKTIIFLMDHINFVPIRSNVEVDRERYDLDNEGNAVRHKYSEYLTLLGLYFDDELVQNLLSFCIEKDKVEFVKSAMDSFNSTKVEFLIKSLLLDANGECKYELYKDGTIGLKLPF